jgi:hypothetical protein
VGHPPASVAPAHQSMTCHAWVHFGHESNRLLRSSHPYRNPSCKDAQVKKQFGVCAGDINPDTAIVPADVLSKQALDGQAEDLAMEDTLYALEKAMQAGSLAPDVYIKQVGHPACEGLFFALIQ